MERIKDKYTYLKSEDLKLLAEYAKVHQYPKGSEVIVFGKYAPNFYYVLEGVIRGYHYIQDSEAHNIFLINNEQFFISPDTFMYKEKKTSTYIFEAVTDLTVFEINYRLLLKLANENQRIFEFYHDALKVILVSFLERIQLLTLENAEQRFLHLEKNRPLIPAHAPKKYLAQFLGITPNSFSRILKELKEKD